MEARLNQEIVDLQNRILQAENETIDALTEADTSAFFYENETNELHMTIVSLEESLAEINLAHEMTITSLEDRNLELEARIRSLPNAYKTTNIVVSLPQDHLDSTRTNSHENETAQTVNDSATKKEEMKKSLLRIFDILTPKDTEADRRKYPIALFKHCDVKVPSAVSEIYNFCDDRISRILETILPTCEQFVRSIICLALSGHRQQAILAMVLCLK